MDMVEKVAICQMTMSANIGKTFKNQMMVLSTLPTDVPGGQFAPNRFIPFTLSRKYFVI